MKDESLGMTQQVQINLNLEIVKYLAFLGLSVSHHFTTAVVLTLMLLVVVVVAGITKDSTGGDGHALEYKA